MLRVVHMPQLPLLPSPMPRHMLSAGYSACRYASAFAAAMLRELRF